MNSFEIKDYIDSYIFKVYNLMSRINYALNYNKIQNVIRKNSELKNKHVGKRCFIIGTGPSLSNIDLSQLTNEMTFAVNFLYKNQGYRNITPDYYMLSDEFFFNQGVEYLDEIFGYINKSCILFNFKGFDIVNKCKNKPDNIYYIYQKLFPHKNLTIIDPSTNMTIGMNVVTGCIQIAMYMGFKEIYLLGSDYNSFASTKSQHCYIENEDRTISLAEELKFFSYATNFHYYLEDLSKVMGIKIFNATEGSLLDAYEKIKFEDIMFG